MTVSPASQGNSQGVSSDPRRNIFEDPAIAQAAANDPLMRWVLVNWKILVALAAAVILATVAYLRFTAVALEKRTNATKTLNEIQTTYASLVEKEGEVAELRGDLESQSDPKERESRTTKITQGEKEIEQLRDKVVLMADSLVDPKSFGTIASMYKGLIASRRQQFDETKRALEEIHLDQLGAPDAPERFVGEVVALALARSLVDSEQYRALARETIVTLAQKGEVVAPRAANALGLISNTPEEKAQAESIVASVQSRFPGQQAYLSARPGTQDQ